MQNQITQADITIAQKHLMEMIKLNLRPSAFANILDAQTDPSIKQVLVDTFQQYAPVDLLDRTRKIQKAKQIIKENDIIEKYYGQ